MTNLDRARRALVARILDGNGESPPMQRRAAFDHAGVSGPLGVLVDKVARHAFQVTDDDVAAVRRSGLSEDQVFELVVCAAIGEATRQYETGLAALEAAACEE